MKITAIKQQVKKADRFSIFIDGKYAFSLSQTGLINSGLKLDQEISLEELKKQQNEALIDKAYRQTLNLLARRPRSEWELRDYLRHKGYDPTSSGSVLELLRGRGYVDDLKFGRAWVENRRLLKASSKRRLKQELRQKRIADDIIEQVLNEDETDEREVLRQLVARKRQQSRYQDKLKLMQYLSRQGYSYDDIKSVINEVEPEV